MRKKKTLLLTGLLLMALCMAAQTPVAISDETAQRLQAFNEHQDAGAANGFFAQLDKEEFTEQKIQFAATKSQDTLRAQVWYWASEYYYAAGHYQEAVQYAQQALPLLKQGKDETTLADCLNVLAIANVRMGRHAEAIDYARQVYDLDEQSNDLERISMSLNTLAGLYISARQPQEAEKYVVRGLEIARQSGLEHRQAIVEGMAAEMYHALGQDERAAAYAEQAYQRELKLARPHKAMIRLSQKAAALIGLKRYDEARCGLDEAVGYFREHGDQQQSLAFSLNQRGEALLGLRQTEAAKADFREAARLFMAMGDCRNEMHSRQSLYNCLYKTQPELTMNDIAQRCGFADNAHFTHAFKRVFGTTPSKKRATLP